MIFHEIYGAYFNAVARILGAAVNGTLDEPKMKAFIDENAFSESFLEIIPALKGGTWKLINPDFSTPLHRIPSMPLSELQLRWLKSISLDKRIRLFCTELDFLKDVEPLFLPDDYVLFDKYSDGDPFESKKYADVFRTVLKAVKEHKRIKTEYLSTKGKNRRIICEPYEIEYSEKDDKFRVNVVGCRNVHTMNIAGIEQCEIIGEAKYERPQAPQHSEEYFIADLTDERNALERFLLHFAHFKKEARQLSGSRYRITVYYDKRDETELVIRILSFGPFVRIRQPQSLVDLIKERLNMQKICGLK